MKKFLVIGLGIISLVCLIGCDGPKGHDTFIFKTTVPAEETTISKDSTNIVQKADSTAIVLKDSVQ